MATDYTPIRVGSNLDGMRWTGQAWAPICPVHNVAMTEYNACAEWCCPVCGVSHIEFVRDRR